MKEEILPYVEAKYRIDSTKRILIGHSAGATAVYYFTFRHAPRKLRFQGAIAADDGIEEDFHPGTLARDAHRLTSHQSCLQRARWNGAVQEVPLPALVSRIQSRNYQGLSFAERRDTDHGGAIYPSFEQGLDFIFGVENELGKVIPSIASGLLVSALSATSIAEEPSLGIPSGGGEHGHPVHVRLDSAATYGIGGQSYLGIDLKMSGYLPVWDTRLGTGSIDAGVVLAYGNEPTWLAPWIDTSQVQATHRISLLARLGTHFFTSVSVAAPRSVSTRLAVFAEWISAYSVNYQSEGISGSAALKRSLFVSGGELDFLRTVFRSGRSVVSGTERTVSPIPVFYAQTMFHVGAGLTFYLR